MKLLQDKLYVWLVWCSSAAMIAASCALLVLMLANVIGHFRFSSMDSQEANRALGFWLPSGAERPLPPEVARRTAAWRALALDDEPIIESDRLEDLQEAGVRVLILPDARQLSDAQIESLEDFLEQGGGVVMTGSLAVRGPDGGWLGYERMRALLQVSSVTPLPGDQSDQVSAWQQGPLSSGLGPARRFAIQPEPGVPAVDSERSELRWNKAVSSSRAEVGASVRLLVGRGRLAWIGPGPEVVFEATENDRLALERVLRNSVDWVRGDPNVELLPWPEGALFSISLTPGPPLDGTNLSSEQREAMAKKIISALSPAATRGEHMVLTLPTAAPGDPFAGQLKARVVGQLEQREAWIASPGEVRSWQSARSQMLLGLRRVGPSRLLVDVTNRSEVDMAGATVRVWLNRPTRSVRLDQTTVLQAMPEIRHRRGEEAVDIELPGLEPGTTRSYYLDLENDDSDGDESIQAG